MEYIIINTLIGTVAGILTYVLISIAVKIFREIITPWFQKKIYRGHSIEGEWYGYGSKVDERGGYIPDEKSESTIMLKQYGNKVKGELLLTKQPTGEKCRKLFDLSGSFVDTILVLNVRVRDSNNMGSGSAILKLTENGNSLKGKHMSVSSRDWNTIFCNSAVWIKKNNQ